MSACIGSFAHHPFVGTKSSDQSFPPTKLHHSISLLQICRSHEIELIQVHSVLIKTNLIQETRAFGRLLLSFASLSNSTALEHAQKLFDSADCPKNTFIYNTMIRAYSRCANPEIAVVLYSKMVTEDCYSPDDFTFTFALTACSKLSAAFEGKQVHAQMVKHAFLIGTHSQNSLIDFYVKTGETGSMVRRLFDEIREPDVVSWNCLLDGCVKSGELKTAQKMFNEMPNRDIVSWTTMLVGYANAGLLSSARRLFDEMPERNLIAWSAMISGYAQQGCYKEALSLFKKMQVLDVKSDKVMMTTLLSACSNLGALDQGRWIHAYIDKQGIEIDAHLSSALIDMYGKCGEIDAALRIFRETVNRKVSVWNAVLGGLAMHSRGEEAIELFSEMLESGLKPNEITFICALAACSHSGLVSDGLQIFNSMKYYNVVPTVEHYGCLVDLLGRAGLLNDAKRVIETMPIEADGNIWRALLGACRVHGDVKLGEHVGRILIELEPANDGNYVLLSNIYAIGKKWEEVAKLRRMMQMRSVRKTPGCSSIELSGVVHEFVAGEQSHPQSKEIFSLLEKMSRQLLATKNNEQEMQLLV